MPKPTTTTELDDFLYDEEGDLTEEAEEELPGEDYDDERDIDERADGYPVDGNGTVLCQCSLSPCIHNNPRPSEDSDTEES